MRTLGLTGGIGSGKSTVAGMLAARGAAVIDADALSRATTAAGGSAIADIASAFGPAFIDGTGALDRDRMRDLVFTQPGARQRLEAIIHPRVAQATRDAAGAAREAGARLAVFDIPLLVESGRWTRQVDRVLVVDCSTATQVARVVARSGLEPPAVERIIAAQAPRALRRAAADFVLFNEACSLAELALAVARIGRTMGL